MGVLTARFDSRDYETGVAYTIPFVRVPSPVLITGRWPTHNPVVLHAARSLQQRGASGDENIFRVNASKGEKRDENCSNYAGRGCGPGRGSRDRGEPARRLHHDMFTEPDLHGPDDDQRRHGP